LKFIFSPFRKKKGDELKKALRELTLYRYNLANLDLRIKSKMQIMEGKLSTMNRNKDEAKILANEYVVLARVSLLVGRIDLLLLKLSLRLESLIEFKSLIMALQEASTSLNKLKPYLAGISDTYGLLIGQLNEAMQEMGTVSISTAGISIPMLDEDAENVLNNAIDFTLGETDVDTGVKEIILQAAKDGQLVAEVA
jgi:division protein CdvB (Snf7/Vps24/ESCRT-III family)